LYKHPTTVNISRSPIYCRRSTLSCSTASIYLYTASTPNGP
jgi:hypothetical protein